MNTDEVNLHRYLDDAFADIPRTPETQDLKEEIRGNLAARVAELESTGMKPDAATAKAITELGDIHELVDSIGESTAGSGAGDTAARLITLNRVKANPLYVVRTVLVALLLAASLVLVALCAVHVLDRSHTAAAIIAVLSGVFGGLLVVDALVHETSQHFAMPVGRAVGFGLATLVGLPGLGLTGIYFGNVAALWLLVVGCALALVSLVTFIALGVTQTNRSKPWVKEMNRAYAIEDRFSQDPAAAARFGIYTVVIWVVALAVFVVLTILTGFAWSWLALLAGLAVFMFVLARMLFPAEAKKNK